MKFKSTLLLALLICLLSTTTLAASYTIATGSSQDAMQAIFDNAVDGDTIVFEAGEHVINSSLQVINKAVTINGNGAKLLLKNHIGYGASTPASYTDSPLFVHFTKDSTAVGNLNINGLELVVDNTNVNSIGLRITDESPTKNTINIDNIKVLSNSTKYTHALMLNEWVPLGEGRSNHFDVNITNSTFDVNSTGANCIGIGPGTPKEGESDFMDCSLNIDNCTLGENSKNRYGVHSPYHMKDLVINNTSINNYSAGGVKIQESEASNTEITNCEFLATPSNWKYALMVTNSANSFATDSGFNWLDKMTGNNFNSQNLLMLSRNPMNEVFWLSKDENNPLAGNIVNAGTRLVTSGSSANKGLVLLIDFSPSKNLLHFPLVTDPNQTVRVKYNPDNTDADDISTFFNDTNPAGVSNIANLTSRQEALGITNYVVENPAIAEIKSDDNGEIEIAPLAIGKTRLAITVGGGTTMQIRAADFANARTKYVDIIVGDLPATDSPVPTATATIAPTTVPTPAATPTLAPTTQVPLISAPKTGDNNNIVLYMVLFGFAVVGMLVGFKKRVEK